MNREEIRKKYLEIRDLNEARLSKLKKEQFIISMTRLLVFAGGCVLSAIAFSWSTLSGIFAVFLTVTFFIILVKKSAEYSDLITFTGNLAKINEHEISALDGDYTPFDGAPDLIDLTHDFAADLDLFGEDSLFRYLNRTVTGPGRSILASWLSNPFSLRDQVEPRQEAVRELAGKLAWRQQFAAYGLDKPLKIDEIESLARWLNESEDYFSSAFMKLISVALPLAALVSLILVVSGLLPFIIFLLVFVINIMVIGLFLRKSNRIHAMVTRKQDFLSSAGLLINTFENEEFTSKVLAGIRNKICVAEGSVARKIKELNNIIRLFDSRLNMFAGFLLNGLLLWDFHCIRKLEKWRKSAADKLPLWLNLLGEADALCSFANYAYNNPDHSFPVVTAGAPVISASGMGHPLLNREIRVDNDFSIGKSGLVVIITGANMAGKSTFLRTVAVNMILAMTGAPVCAASMKVSPVKLFTSMRSADSLSRNESYFYAELKRLKTLKAKLEIEENVFFILDEILKGTNSTDKSTGSRMFLRRLVQLGGTGLIATHDISLGDMEDEFPENIDNKCFEIDIEGENIKFDYKIRDGITRKMNATVLMKQMGIG